MAVRSFLQKERAALYGAPSRNLGITDSKCGGLVGCGVVAVCTAVTVEFTAVRIDRAH